MGLVGLSNVVSQEGLKNNIKSNVIAPIALTRMTTGIMDNLGLKLDPEYVTSMVVYLASDAAAAITGRVFGVHGNQMFEYKMVQTPGVTKDGIEPWTQEEISARWDDKAERVVFERQEPPAKPAEPEKHHISSLL